MLGQSQGICMNSERRLWIWRKVYLPKSVGEVSEWLKPTNQEKNKKANGNGEESWRKSCWVKQQSSTGPVLEGSWHFWLWYYNALLLLFRYTSTTPLQVCTQNCDYTCYVVVRYTTLLSGLVLGSGAAGVWESWWWSLWLGAEKLIRIWTERQTGTWAAASVTVMLLVQQFWRWDELMDCVMFKPVHRAYFHVRETWGSSVPINFQQRIVNLLFYETTSFHRFGVPWVHGWKQRRKNQDHDSGPGRVNGKCQECWWECNSFPLCESCE